MVSRGEGAHWDAPAIFSTSRWNLWQRPRGRLLNENFSSTALSTLDASFLSFLFQVRAQTGEEQPAHEWSLGTQLLLVLSVKVRQFNRKSSTNNDSYRNKGRVQTNRTLSDVSEVFCCHARCFVKNRLWMLVAVKEKQAVWSGGSAACLLIALPYISFPTNIKDTALLEDIEMHNNRPRGALNPKASCTAGMRNINVPYVALICAAHCTKTQSALFNSNSCQVIRCPFGDYDGRLQTDCKSSLRVDHLPNSIYESACACFFQGSSFVALHTCSGNEEVSHSASPKSVCDVTYATTPRQRLTCFHLANASSPRPHLPVLHPASCSLALAFSFGRVSSLLQQNGRLPLLFMPTSLCSRPPPSPGAPSSSHQGLKSTAAESTCEFG